jgi:hypothetical protein
MSAMFNFTVKNQKEALKEFRRLRNYYRKHYEAGDNDAVFKIWIEVMIDRDRKSKGLTPLFDEEDY